MVCHQGFQPVPSHPSHEVQSAADGTLPSYCGDESIVSPSPWLIHGTHEEDRCGIRVHKGEV
ncbi:hypothetical protein BaRGS_00038452, partial [Batillaria attramentaria]